MGNIRLYGSTSGYTELAPPAVAPDGVLSLPSGTGTLATQDFAAGAGGLVHINTTTFSAVSSVSLNDVFTSAYQNYRILINFTSGSGNLTFRLRASGSDSSTGYVARYANISDASFAADRGNNAAQLGLGSITNAAFSALDVLQPQLAIRTSMGVHSIGAFSNSSASGNVGVGGHYLETAYDGCSIFGTSMTGTIRVYGYKD